MERGKAILAEVAGHDPHTGIIILALATRHRVERPAIRMEGGTLILWSGLARRRLYSAFENTVNPLIRTTLQCGFCRFIAFHRETD